MTSLRAEPGSSASLAGAYPLGHERFLLSPDVNFTTCFFLRDKLPINMKMLVFFLAKCVRTAVKTMVVDTKNQKALALLYLASKPPRKAADSSGVPTEFATEPTRQICTFRLNFIA